MATKKKSAKKSRPNTKKRPTEKSRTTTKTRSVKRAAPARLTHEEKLSKLKPGDDLNELVAEIVTAWSRVKRQVRVADVSPAKLGSLLKKASRASERENALRAKQEAKLAPLSDARIVANDAVYRAALKVKRIADAVGAADTSVAEAFASVSERFRKLPATKEAPPEG